MPETLSIPLDRPALPVAVRPGGEVVLRGSFVSTTDGATVDAATTTWPADAPGGASVDSGGLVDFEAGGFHVTSRDPATHEVHAVATGDPAAACGALGVAAPCLPLRVLPQARTRLLTVSDWTRSLKGGISVEVPETVLPPVAPSVVPYLYGALGLLGVLVVAVLGLRASRRRKASPRGQLLELARRVREKARGADAVVAAPLTPAIDAALRALREGRVDPASAEGRRVSEALRRVESRIEATAAKARADEEQRAADELVREVEDALAAADEVSLGERRAG